MGLGAHRHGSDFLGVPYTRDRVRLPIEGTGTDRLQFHDFVADRGRIPALTPLRVRGTVRLRMASGDGRARRTGESDRPLPPTVRRFKAMASCRSPCPAPTVRIERPGRPHVGQHRARVGRLLDGSPASIGLRSSWVGGREVSQRPGPRPKWTNAADCDTVTSATTRGAVKTRPLPVRGRPGLHGWSARRQGGPFRSGSLPRTGGSYEAYHRLTHVDCSQEQVSPPRLSPRCATLRRERRVTADPSVGTPPPPGRDSDRPGRKPGTASRIVQAIAGKP